MSTHAIHDLHRNSLAAYWSGKEDLFGKREQEVLAILRRTPGLTAREVALAMGSQDPNRSRPRISSLVKDGVLQELPETALDPISGKNVARFRIKEDPRGPKWRGQTEIGALLDQLERAS